MPIFRFCDSGFTIRVSNLTYLLMVKAWTNDGNLKCVGVYLSELVHLVHLLLALLEAPEVVLNEERGVELADSDVVVS